MCFKDPAKVMCVVSVISSVLLFVGALFGFMGSLLPIPNPLSLVVNLYNMIFSLFIAVEELRHIQGCRSLCGWFHERVDKYFHFISTKVGKGLFYLFVATLAFVVVPGCSEGE